MLSDINIDLLRSLLRLDPDTGKLYWLPRLADQFSGGARDPEWRAARWNSRHAGREALTIGSEGYRVGYALGFKILGHRAAFALHHGRWPVGQVDHINGVRLDNRPINLREVNNRQNARNHKPFRNNTSGVPGVVWNKAEGKWKARIHDDTGRVNLGTFDRFDDAAAARRAAEVRLGYTCPDASLAGM